jgi:hypothetical protein
MMSNEPVEGLNLKGGNMTGLNNEQEEHKRKNIHAFVEQYKPKYENGALQHSGDMWTMGLKQALENAEDECLDNWSYLRQIRKCMEELESVFEGDWCEMGCHVHDKEKVDEIINRVKKDD